MSIGFILLYAVLCIGIIGLLVCMLRYRLPAARPREVFEGEVHYRMIDVDFSLRNVYEQYVGNRPLYLVDSPRFYLRARDKNRLWPESPLTMHEKNYTMKARLSVRPLLFGGYGFARLESLERVDIEPTIQK